MSIELPKYIGRGVYSIPEVARYTGSSTGKVHSWFVGSGKKRLPSIFKSDFPAVENRYAVSFYDLIDALIVKTLRDEEISLQSIRRVYTALRQDLQVAHPFCRKDLYFFKAGQKLLIRTTHELGEEEFHDVVTQQCYFPDLIRRYLKKIQYDKDSLLAERWKIDEGVIIDPAVRFGKPIAKSTGVTTHVLASAFHANSENARLVSEMFAVTSKNVTDAVAFEKKVHLRKAA